MVLRKIYLWGFIFLVLVAGVNLCAGALQESKPLINGSSIYLSPGESWPFYQGYSLNLKSISEDGKQGWVQLELNNTVVKTEILSLGDTFFYNVTTRNAKEIVLFRFTVSGIYSGQDYDILTFSPVYQYYDFDLPAPTPLPTIKPNNQNNSSATPPPGDDDSTGIPGFMIIQIVIIISLCSILIRRFS